MSNQKAPAWKVVSRRGLTCAFPASGCCGVSVSDRGSLPFTARLGTQRARLAVLSVDAAEQRIRARGLHRAELAVEECNPRARALYERLGYAAYGRKPEAWDEQTEDGAVRRYETVCTLMRKELS